MSPMSPMIIIANLIFATFLVSGAPAQAQFTPGDHDHYTVSFTSTGLEKVRIENSSGYVHVQPTDTDRTYVTFDKKKYPENCQMKFEHVTATELIAQVTGDGCLVDLDLKVPNTVDLNIKTISGSIEVHDTIGRLTFASASGAVTARGQFKDVQGRSQSGAIDLAGVQGGGQLDSESGGVRVKFLPDISGQFQVSTQSGQANLLFPKGAKLNASVASVSGGVETAFADDAPRADFKVRAQSQSGDVKVMEY